MIAEATPSANAGALPFNWFDAVVVLAVLFGLFRGRRNGMSKELLPLLQWLVLVPVCGFGYPILGGILIKSVGLSKLSGFLLAYLALAFAVFLFFSILRHRSDEKLAKSNFFKGVEYYLGMMAGAVRYACVLIFVLALLNARFYTRDEISSALASDKANLGGGLFPGTYFPHLFTIQNAVFKQSLFGPIVKKDLARLLIFTTEAGRESPEGGAPPQKKPVIHIGNH